MNRQLRRAQAKQDTKAERDKQKKKQARRQKIETVKERRRARRIVGAKPEPLPAVEPSQMTPEQRKKMPGRFSGALMIATVFFIVLQAAVPPEDVDLMTTLTGSGFFLMFGYFSTLFLLRRGSDKAFGMTIVSGLALAGGVLATRLVGPETGFDSLFVLMIGLGAVLSVAGAYLGRAVFNAARRA